MARKKITVIPFKRKKQGKTNYKKRLAYIKSGSNRLVVRRTGRNIKAQVVQYKPVGDVMLLTADVTDLKKLGWKLSNNMSAAYLVGYLIGKKIIKAKAFPIILDIGLITPVKKSKIFGVLKGVIDAGVDIHASEEVLPTDDMINGKAISEYAKSANESNSSKFQFSRVKKDVSDLPKLVEEMRKKIELNVK